MKVRYLILNLICLITVSCSYKNKYQIIPLDSPTGSDASLPRLFTDNSGTVFMSWVETKQDTSYLYYSSLVNDEWNNPIMIQKSDSWFVNWADYPSIIAKDGKPIAAHWLKKIEGGTYAYNVEVASAKNNWNKVITPHTDNTQTEHGFVSMVPASDSSFISIWLDGRNTAGHGGHNNHDSGADLSTAMTLRSAILDMDLNVLESFEIDDSVCDCCGTSAVKTSNGFITAYRNRTQDEIRDIYVSKLTDSKWSTPVAVSNDGWKIAACPVNGPAITANGEKIAIAWYTGANNKEQLKLAFSDDEGGSFKEPLIIDDGNPIGRVDIEFLDSDKLLVSWMERNMEDRSKAFFKAKLFSSSGEFINEFELSEMSSSRRSGFPQISSYGIKAVAAWTVLGEGSSQIKTLILE